MSVFRLYFDLGINHILDFNGFDHMVFIIVLCAIYLLKDWSKVLVLVTAFTIGHSITLALATLRIISVNSEIVEFLIPLTIFITAVSNIIRGKGSGRRIQFNYYLALFFGLIHGLGFSNNLRSLLGSNEDILVQLLAFNIGIEVGQVVIVVVFLFLSFILVDLVKVARRDWRIVISSAGAGIALILLLQNKFW